MTSVCARCEWKSINSMDEAVAETENGWDILHGCTSLNGSLAHSGCGLWLCVCLRRLGAVDTAIDRSFANLACSASVWVASFS